MSKVVGIGEHREPEELYGFKSGGCVRLASGGPKLTIKNFVSKTKSAIVEWFNVEGMYEHAEFRLVQLRHAPEDAPTVADDGA